MGPKKDKKETVVETKINTLSIDYPINTENWRCVVTLGMEKTGFDTYALREFMEESVKGRRQDITVIDYETSVLKILNDFANGEVPYKYKLLLNFSPLFEEAAECIRNRMDIPTNVLVKIIKALLFHIREESLIRIQNVADRNTDPIKAMAARPSYLGENEKKKDMAKKGGNGLKVRPPSITKQETNLLKRGERAKDDQCIDDSPRNGYFNHYVLLIGFYNADFPLELIKGGIPLHAVLCIDTSRSGMRWETSASINKFSRRNTEIKTKDVQNFWSAFLRTLWHPEDSYYFRDTIFQLYMPRKLCKESSLRKFLYKEISYLMYDLSDLKRKLNNYLNHIHLWDVTKRDTEAVEEFVVPDFLPNECITVPIVLQCMIDAVCNTYAGHGSEFNISLVASQYSLSEFVSPSLMANRGSCLFGTDWDMDLERRGDCNLLSIYYKLKELDVLYGLDRGLRTDSENSEDDSFGTICPFEVVDCGENMKEALVSSDTMFNMLWSKYKVGNSCSLPVDYCLYASLLSKVSCSYEAISESSSNTTLRSISRSIDFETFNYPGIEMRKPHFTVTEGSRSIIKSIPYNMKSPSRDFFCPQEFKVVSPEKLRASSAPQFRVCPCLKVETLYTSDIFSSNHPYNPYESLRGFVDDCLFAKTNDFDCIEFLSKHKLLVEEKAAWANYNCRDHSYCAFNDSILLKLHNRKDGQNFQHETFHEKLRTIVGLRDFYEYVQEDEEEWLTLQEESYQAKVMLSNRVLESNSLRDFENSDFWLTNSLKYQAHGKRKYRRERSSEIKIAYSSTEKLINTNFRSIDVHTSFVLDEELEGFDLGNTAVQYSGLKTVFYSEECIVAVQLIERLYGNQDLGVHVTQASHTLHLHSYVCPEPHILDPFTFHITYNNGIIVAFCRRFVETFEKAEQDKESVVSGIRGLQSQSSIHTKVSTLTKDEDFRYDMAASLPNGLCFRTVRGVVEPCYIKQYYVGKKNNKSMGERSRLYLPNGIIVVMMTDNTVKILKPNTSLITAHLKDLIKQPGSEKYTFSSYQIISEEGRVREIENGSVKSSFRYRLFQKKHWDTNKTFYRRLDGTTYLLEKDGSLCVEFLDGTKIWTSVFLEEGEAKEVEGFTFVHMKIVSEHPDYATVKCNTRALELEILIPGDSTIIVHPDGHYSVDVDKTTKLEVQEDVIELNQLGVDGSLACNFKADLSVFEKQEAKYCQLKDSLGKTFVVESNSNCYVIDSENISMEEVVQKQQSEPDAPSFSHVKGEDTGLCRESKYLVVKRDLSAMRILHVDDVSEVLNNIEKGTLVFTQTLPGKEYRCFVLISPVVSKKFRKWQVNTVLPNPKSEEKSGNRQISSIYGVELSSLWMHPLPKKKKKFVIPPRLTCRVFIETKKTKLSPPVGSLDCFFCEMDDVTQVEHTQILPNAVDRYLYQLAHDNQQILKEMYALTAHALIHNTRKPEVDHTEKLQSYLENSKKCRKMREHYKKCIRFRKIPRYFEYPYGNTWAIINEILKKLSPEASGNTSSDIISKTDMVQSSSIITDSISDREIEYDLSVSDEQSFSSLSHRSALSSETAPAILKTTSVRCKVQPTRKFSSCPDVVCRDRGVSVLENIEELTTPPCEILQDEIETFEKTERTRTEKPPLCLEDLMFLGFV